MYARTLIVGWLRMWQEKNPNHSVDLLSFSDPQLWDVESELFTSKNVCLHNYYSLDVNTIVNKDAENLQYILKTIKLKPQNTVIVDCLSSLVLYNGLAKALWFVEKLHRQVSQMICIYRRDFIQNKVVAIETLGTTYVKLEKFPGIKPSRNNLMYIAHLTHRKSVGSIIRQTEVVHQDSTSYEICTISHRTSKTVSTSKDRKIEENTKQPKIESTFRIEMSSREMEQRNQTSLPYIINATNNTANNKTTPKILYQPDEEDDIDEDDPDNDLYL